jgi:hypothetical protein
LIKATLKIFTYVVILLLLGFLLKPLPNFAQPKAIQLPWSLNSDNEADKHYQYLDNGQIIIEITHVPLINITPQMLHWFYQNMPASTVQISKRQQRLSWYQIFHPSEHGVIHLLESDEMGIKKTDTGTLMQKEEWFGPYYKQGTERIILLSDQGMKVQFELAGLTFGHSEHVFIQTSGGSQYKIRTTIGSDLPIIGPIINVILRYKMFPKPMLEHWIRHQVEEISNLNAFLPQLYIAPKQEDHYLLKLN